MADEDFLRVGVDIAGGGADLLIGIRAQVLHEKIENTGVALQNSKQLERSILGLDFGFRRGRRNRRGLDDQVEFGGQIIGQHTGEKEREKRAKGKYDSMQVSG